MKKQIISSIAVTCSILVSATALAAPLGNYDGALVVSSSPKGAITRTEVKAYADEPRGNYGD